MAEIRIMNTMEAYRISSMLAGIFGTSAMISLLIPTQLIPRFFVIWFTLFTLLFAYYSVKNYIKLAKEK